MHPVLAKYNVPRNPFEPVPLNPVDNADDGRMLVPVDGFANLDPLDAAFQSASDRGGPVFVMVVGASGSGRSSLANCVVARYRDHRHVSQDRFLWVDLRVENHNAHEHFRAALVDLEAQLDEKGLGMTDALRAEFQQCQQAAMDLAGERRLKNLFRHISTDLGKAAEPVAFGLCFDKLLSYDLIRIAFSVLENARAVCVFTVDDYGAKKIELIEPFRDAAPPNASKTLLQLGLISGAEIRRLIEDRWNFVNRNRDPIPPNPFPPQDVEQILGGLPRTVGRVLRMTGQMIERRAQAVDDAQPWPGNSQLGFSRQQLKELVQYFDGGQG
ncbi:MAG: ATP-binding protein [Acidobacteria bacterium]|nr:ATP-binding protein [Acidobacteriota bacterium]